MTLKRSLYGGFRYELNFSYAEFRACRNVFYRGDDDFNFDCLRRERLFLFSHVSKRKKGKTGSRRR